MFFTSLVAASPIAYSLGLQCTMYSGRQSKEFPSKQLTSGKSVEYTYDGVTLEASLSNYEDFASDIFLTVGPKGNFPDYGNLPNEFKMETIVGGEGFRVTFSNQVVYSFVEQSDNVVPGGSPFKKVTLVCVPSE